MGASTSAVGRCDEMMIRLFQRRRGCPDEARDRAIEPSSDQAIHTSTDGRSSDRRPIERPIRRRQIPPEHQNPKVLAPCRSNRFRVALAPLSLESLSVERRKQRSNIIMADREESVYMAKLAEQAVR